MKKIIFLVILAIGVFFAWQYFKNPNRKQTAPEQTTSVATDTWQAIDATVNYVPNAIDRKNQMESKINDSVNIENERIQKSLEELKQ